MIYLDNQATTRCDPRVVDAMLPWFSTHYGNPHSAEHAMGQAAADAVETARGEIARLIGAAPSEIVLTSGATEANNIAIKGAARFAGANARRRIVTLATEHKCVLESVRDLEPEGFEPVVLPVRADGTLDLAVLEAALRVPTLLVSVMAVNNETGVRQDLAAIARIAHASGALLHSDAAQAAGKMPLDVAALGLDLASISAHKIYGPKGVGALYVRRRPRVRLNALLSGGGQERGLRSGTLPVPLVVGFGAACRIAGEEWQPDEARIGALRHRLLDALRREIPGLHTHGGEGVLPGCLSLRFAEVQALDLIAACPGLCVSTGSACTSAAVAPSHVLAAMGLQPAEAARTLRVGIGRFTSASDIDAASALLVAARARLIRSPTTEAVPLTPAEA